jgi:hypothetical protein
MSQNLNNQTDIIKDITENDWGLFVDIELHFEPKKNKYNRIKASQHVSVPLTIHEYKKIRYNNESLMFKMDEDYEDYENEENDKDNNNKYSNHETNKVNSVYLYTKTCGIIAFVLCCIIML